MVPLIHTRNVVHLSTFGYRLFITTLISTETIVISVLILYYCLTRLFSPPVRPFLLCQTQESGWRSRWNMPTRQFNSCGTPDDRGRARRFAIDHHILRASGKIIHSRMELLKWRFSNRGIGGGHYWKSHDSRRRLSKFLCHSANQSQVTDKSAHMIDWPERKPHRESES